LNYKKLAAAVAATALVVGALLGGAAARAADTTYRDENTPLAQGQILEAVTEIGGRSTDSTLALQPGAVDIGGVRGEWKMCKDVADPVCDRTNPNIDVHAQLIAPYCQTDTQLVCLQSLEIAAPGGEFQKADFVRAASKGRSFAAAPELGFPGGATPLIFSAKNAPSVSGGTEYTVSLMTYWHWRIQENKFTTNMFELSVTPTHSEPGQRNSGCYYVEDGTCGVNDDWAPGTKARAVFRIPNSIGGWFKGRLNAPIVNVKPGPGDNNIVSVEAEPVTVPRLALARNQAEFTPQEENWHQNNGGWSVTYGNATGYDSAQNGIANYIDFYRPMLNDTATGTNTFWNVSTTYSAQGNQCLQDTSKVLGIVTTNATGYDGTSPSFDNGMLSYHVSGLHYAPDGKTLNEGTYDLVMRSDTARCLYGFSKAPVQATISVIDDKGEAKTAVTTVNEKDGWLTMRAYGFTFSNPVVNVKITQAKDPSAAGSGASSVGKTTITCVKGKLTKKVSGTAPKCPAGYKKK